MEYNQVVLECVDLLKRFDATVAVRNLSFSLNKGDILGLVGENGAGKSTLVKMIGGEHPFDGGGMRYRGESVRWKDAFHALQNGIAIVHQHPLLVEDFTAEENIFLGKEIARPNGLVDNRSTSRKGAEIKSKYSIVVDLDLKRTVRNMSAGEKQVVEILKALSYEPNILMLDEPTASLPKEEAEKLIALMRHLNEEDQLTIIYISHKLEEVFDVCNRIMVMRNGENAGILGREEFDKDRLITMIVNQDLRDFYPKKSRKVGQKLLETRELCSDRLKNVSINVCGGEIVGLYGLMGAGMSELAETIFGLRKYADGRIEVFQSGRAQRTNGTVREAVRRGIYLVPEDRLKYGLIPSFNIRENTSLAHLRALFREALINRSKETKLVAQELAKIHVKYAGLEQSIHELSGGNQQKVVVSRWLLKDCIVLILDDPTTE